MGMSAASMAGLIADNIIAVNPAAKKPDLIEYWIPICNGIIASIVADAVVNPTNMVDGLSAPVTGTGDIE